MIRVNLPSAYEIDEGLFDVASPQEIADMFGDVVMDENGCLYYPKKEE